MHFIKNHPLIWKTLAGMFAVRTATIRVRLQKIFFAGGIPMNQVMSAVTKGLAAGAVVGTASYMMNHKKSKGKIMKKSASKAMKTIGTVMENVAYMIK